MNLGELNKLTANYIFEEEERLRMALHVYEAMPTVRKYVIKNLFEKVGNRVGDAISVVKKEFGDGYGVYLRTEKTGRLYVYAWLYDHEYHDGRSRSVLSLVAGIYGEVEAKKEELRERLKTKVDLKTWSYGKEWLSEHKLDPGIAFTFEHHEHGAEWPYNAFLRRIIEPNSDVVSDIADLLVSIHEGVFPSASS